MGLPCRTVMWLRCVGAPPVLLAAVAWALATRSITRDLDLVELFAGKGALTATFREGGRAAVAYDINAGAAENILTTAGWLRALTLVLRLRHGALLWAGVPCSSFVFINRGTSKRSASNPLGSPTQPTVQLANEIVARVGLLLLLAIARGVGWVVEQPGSSLLPQHPRMQLLRQLGLHMCFAHVSAYTLSSPVGG